MLQDWITLNGSAASDSVTQSFRGWMRTEDFSDVVFSLQCKDANVTVTLDYQTSAVEDEPFQVAMESVSFKGATNIQTAIKYASAGTPMASLVRYKVSSATSNWRVAFRLAITLKNA